MGKQYNRWTQINFVILDVKIIQEVIVPLNHLPASPLFCRESAALPELGKQKVRTHIKMHVHMCTYSLTHTLFINKFACCPVLLRGLVY